MRLDVTSDGDAAGLAEAVRVHSDRVDALINNAAIHYDIGQRAADADLGLVGEALETNVIGAWRATRATSFGTPSPELPRWSSVEAGVFCA